MSIGAWSEGDTLSPINLNVRGGGPFSATSTVNVSWSMFSTSRNTTSIESAVNYAHANNYTGIVIPESYLPYDTSAISDFYTVVRACEGGSWDCYDVRAYGADRTGAVDAYSSIQAALNAACSSSPYSLRRVHIPWGVYNTSYPLRIWANGVEVFGDGMGDVSSGYCTEVKGTFWGGALFHLRGKSVPLPTVPRILGSTGYAIQIPQSSNAECIELRMASSSFDINGLSQFCIEFAFRLDTGGTISIITASAGHWLDTDTADEAFVVYVNPTNLFNVLFKTSGGSYQITSSVALTVGVVYVVYIDYDGTTLRLFGGQPGQVNTLWASTAATGTISQGIAEDVTVGARVSAAPLMGFANQGTHGALQSLRYSNRSRHTTTETCPTEPFAKDGFTIGLLNFNQSATDYDLTKLEAQAGDSWVPYRSYDVPGQVNAVSIKKMRIGGGSDRSRTGIYVGRSSGQSGLYSELFIAAVRCGIDMTNAFDGFWWSLSHSNISQASGKGRYGIAIFGTAGIGLIQDTRIYAFPVCIYTGSTLRLSQVYLFGSTTGVLPFIFHSGGQSKVVADSLIIDLEVGLGPDFRACMAIGGNNGSVAVFDGLAVGGSTGTNPNVIVEGGTVVEFHAPTFWASAAAAAIIKVTANPSLPIRITAPFPWGGAPLSDVPGTVTLGTLGKGTAIPTTSTQTFNASLRNQFESTLTANVSASTVIVVTPGQELSWLIKQDSTGNRLWTIPSAVTWGAANPVSIYTAANGWNQIDTIVGLDGNAYVRSFRTGP